MNTPRSQHGRGWTDSPQLATVEALREQGWVDLEPFGDFTEASLRELDIRPVDTDEQGTLLYAIERNYEALVHMPKLQLGMYRDQRGNLLIAATDKNLHPHDRWQYHSPVETPRRWYETAPHDLMSRPLDQGLGLELRNDMDAMQDLARRLSVPVGPSYYWRIAKAPYWVSELLLPLMPKGHITPTDMHDMIFHYRTWAARHPEYAEMPRELVLRMHGFANIIESEKGRDLDARH